MEGCVGSGGRGRERGGLIAVASARERWISPRCAQCPYQLDPAWLVHGGYGNAETVSVHHAGMQGLLYNIYIEATFL